MMAKRWVSSCTRPIQAKAAGFPSRPISPPPGSARARVRQGDGSAGEVTGMEFGYEEEKVRRAVEAARAMEGIGYVRVWLNEGVLQVGDDIMFVLIGGDIRPHVVDALQTLVGTLKNECVTERELF